MPMFHDNFILEVSTSIISASIQVDPESKRINVEPNTRFSVEFTYTIGRPKATADFTYKFTAVGGGSTPNVASQGRFNPAAPNLTKLVNGTAVDIGHSEPQTGVFSAIAPGVAGATVGILTITQPG